MTPPIVRQKRWTPKTKTGCFTCRARRIKCDESKPHCQNCIKTRRKCVGPVPVQPRETRYRPLLAAPPRISGKQVPLTASQINAMKDIQLLYSVIPKILAASATEDQHWSVRASMRATTMAYLNFLPSRAGENIAMDAAVQCLAAAARLHYAHDLSVRSSQTTELNDPRVVLRHNIHALNCLRQALNDPIESVSSETLCATALLCCFESFSIEGTEENQSRHLNGIEELIKHRQPHRFTTSLDRDLFESQVGFMMGKAFFTSTSSFMNQSRWVPVLEAVGSAERGRSPLDSYFTTIRMEFFIFSAPIFETLVQTTRLITREDNLSSPAALRRRRRLLDDLVQTTTKFMDWQWDIESKIQRLMQTPVGGSGQPTGLVCGASQAAGMCKTVELLSNRIRVALGDEDAYSLEMSSRDAALLFIYRLDQDGPAFAALIEMTITKAIITTTKDWVAHAAALNQTQDCEVYDPVIPKEVYLRWLSAMNVALPTD